ncbi:PKD domain-containing protein [Idiomarina seosinensis]|uniref:PKD domain-containing protein n=1 Tax=Idiomarina seosinensis TaxID=281739 RepID=UPI00384F4EE5
MRFLPLTLATLLSLPAAALSSNAWPDVHQLIDGGNLIAGSTLTLDAQQLQIAESSRPDDGFFVLQTLQQVNGKNAYRGFIQQGPDVTLTVLQHRDGSMTKIYQSDAGTEIKQVAAGLRKEPLQPSSSRPRRDDFNDVPEGQAWQPNVADTVNNEPMLSPAPADEQLTRVDTLVLFDPRLPARVNSIGRQFETDLEGAENLTRTIFSNSELTYDHRIIGTHAVKLPSTTDRYINSPTDDVLDELVQSGEVQRLKDVYDADVVHYIGITDQVCGQAFVSSEIDLNNEFNATSLDFHIAYTNYGCLGSGAFAHELGHNLGLYHDRYTLTNNEDGAGESFDNHIPYGYIEPSGAFYSTMAYQSSCTDVFDGAACEPAPVFSNPAVIIDGEPAGESEAVVEAANASRALGLTLPWAAGYSSHQDYAPMSLTPDGDGAATLTWTGWSDETHLLLNRACSTNRFFSASQIAAATEVTGRSAEGTLIDTNQLRACVLAPQRNAGEGYRPIGEYQANLDQSGAQPAYLLTQSNALWVEDGINEYAINFMVSDESLANGDIALATYTAADGSRPALTEGIAQASEWFDVSISGDGAQRTATLTLLKRPNELTAEFTADDLRNPYQLPLALVNTNFNEYQVSSVLWLGDTPREPRKSPAYGFFEQGEFLLNEQPYDIRVLLNNLPTDASVTVEQTGDIRLPGFSYNVTEGDVATQRRIQVEGDPVTISSNSEWKMLARWGERADQQVTLSLTGYAEDGNRVQDVQVLSELVEGQDILLEVTLADLADNSFWDTLEIRRLVAGAEDVVYDTPESQQDNRFVFNIGQLEAGDYEFQVVLDYVDGGKIVYSLDLSIAEGDGNGSVNRAPTVSIDGSVSTVEVDESFTLSASASDPDGDALTYQWQQRDGSDLTLTGVDTNEVTITANSEGSYTVEVIVTDSEGASDTASYSFTAEVTPAPLPPVEETTSGSSGGSAGWMLLVLAALGSLRSLRLLSRRDATYCPTPYRAS